jgi:hypothetical protein
VHIRAASPLISGDGHVMTDWRTVHRTAFRAYTPTDTAAYGGLRHQLVHNAQHTNMFASGAGI